MSRNGKPRGRGTRKVAVDLDTENTMQTMTPLALLLTVCLAGGRPERPVFAVAPTSLNNLSANTKDSVDSATVGVLTQEAESRLAACGYQVIRVDSTPGTAAAPASSYLYDHPDVAAAWGAAHHVDWVFVGRLNRIGRWEADWEVQVVSTSRGRAVDMRAIELKGFGTDSALTAHLATRGAAWLIDQVTQSVAQATGGGAANPRPCHA
jgi:hypothetical protein